MRIATLATIMFLSVGGTALAQASSGPGTESTGTAAGGTTGVGAAPEDGATGGTMPHHMSRHHRSHRNMGGSSGVGGGMSGGGNTDSHVGVSGNPPN